MNSCLLSDGEKENGFCFNSLLSVCLIGSYQSVRHWEKGNILQLPGLLEGIQRFCELPVSFWLRHYQAQMNHN